MAEDFNENHKTEEPTQKRLDDALKRGDVVKSQKVNTWFVIAGGALVLMAFSGGMGKDLTGTMRGLIANAHDIGMNGPALPRLFQRIGAELIAAVALPFLVLILAALAGNIVQHRLVWSFESLKPKLSKISPGRGAQANFLQTIACQFGQGSGQAGAGRRRADGTDGPNAGGSKRSRAAICPSCRCVCR